MQPIEIGLIGEQHTIVTPELTAQALGSGSLPVYATPALVALMEAAAVAALAPHLDADQSSVGTGLDIKHIAATPIGHAVRARAEVIAVDGRTVTFQVQGWDQQELIGEGSHTRVIISVERFMARVTAKNP